MSATHAESYSDEAAARDLSAKQRELESVLIDPGDTLRAAAKFVTESHCTRWVDVFYESPVGDLLTSWIAAAAAKQDPDPHAVAFARALLIRDVELKAGHVQMIIDMERAELASAPPARKYRAPRSDEVVYVIGSAGSTLVKIGRSTNVQTRLRSIQNMSPAPLEVLWTTPGGPELETRLHAALARYRTYGEWFDFGVRNPVKLVKAEVARLAVTR
jgi:hypothetical protein